MSLDEPRAVLTEYVADCRVCGRQYAVWRDESDPDESAREGLHTRCRCGTVNWAQSHVDGDGRRLPADYGPAWVLARDAVDCWFPEYVEPRGGEA